MGALDYLSNFCTLTSTRSRLKPMQTVEIKVKMDCDGCERRVKNAVTSLKGCGSYVHTSISSNELNRRKNMTHQELGLKRRYFHIEFELFYARRFQAKYLIESKVPDRCSWTYTGVKTVEVNRKQSRVVVSGYVDGNKVLKRVKSTGKRAEFWPYIPQHLVHYPYVSGVYDKKAPAGYVRNVVQAFPPANAPEDNIISLFSDDNVNACFIM